MIGVFGGAGFIGRNLIDHLVAVGIEFLSFDRAVVPGHEQNSRIIDFNETQSLLQQVKDLETVILLVSASVPSTFATNLSLEVEHNVRPYARLLQGLDQTSVRRVIYLSSGGTVYGIPETTPIPESHVTRPISNYGCGKLMIELMIQTLGHNASWDYYILRPSNPVGRYQRPGSQGLVSAAISAALSGAKMEIWGDGSIVRDYFDVAYLVDVIAKLSILTPARSAVLNVGGGVGLTVNDVLEMVEHVMGYAINRSYVETRSVDVPVNVLDISELAKIIDLTVMPLSTGTIFKIVSALSDEN